MLILASSTLANTLAFVKYKLAVSITFAVVNNGKISAIVRLLPAILAAPEVTILEKSRALVPIFFLWFFSNIYNILILGTEDRITYIF